MEKTMIPSQEWPFTGHQKGKEKEEDRRNTWKKTVEAEMMKWNTTWGTVEKVAKYRKEWRSFVAALHANGITGSK
jgi:hypothetical protein